MILFVGERRSARAKALGLTWKDGGLAAKPLFEALHACGIDPETCYFVNLFERSGPRTVLEFHGPIVGMGKKVQSRLASMGIKHTPIVHPAARGSIRKRERYIAHVKAALSDQRTKIRKHTWTFHKQPNWSCFSLSRTSNAWNTRLAGA